MYWELFKFVAFVFTPLPIGIEVHRPDPDKYLWTFECTGFQSNYHFMRDICTSPMITAIVYDLLPKKLPSKEAK